MNITNTPITGQEEILETGTPYSALLTFYRAFNTGDLALMSSNWSQTDEASMSNPLGGVKRGWLEIMEVYTRIFDGPATVYVEYYDYSIHQTNDMFCAVGRERGYFRVGDSVVDLAIRTTRFYHREAGEWLQLHHHGSIDNPELLDEYQSMVKHGKGTDSNLSLAMKC